MRGAERRRITELLGEPFGRLGDPEVGSHEDDGRERGDKIHLAPARKDDRDGRSKAHAHGKETLQPTPVSGTELEK